MANNQKNRKNGFHKYNGFELTKQHEENDSYLNIAFQKPHAKCIYNVFIVILSGLLLHTFLSSYFKTGEINVGQKLIRKSFNNIPLLIVIWTVSNLLVYFFYLVFNLWARTRITLSKNHASTLDKIGVFAVIVYYLFSFYFIHKIVLYADFAPASAITNLVEHVRLLMKQHSFLREIAPKVLKNKHNERLKLPSFNQLLYFIFAPVLIYNDFYPRKKRIRWSYVLTNVAELICIVLLLSLVTEKCVLGTFGTVGLKYFSWPEIFLKILENGFTGALFLVVGFYVVLHVVQNAFGELLKFEDRQFYQPWWTATSLSEFYRKWNILVQNWLFRYIFTDLCAQFSIKNKKAARIVTFFISAFVHEWIISLSFKLFFPIQFTQFFVLALVLDVCGLFNKNIGNLIVLHAIAFGTALQVSGYAMEYLARANCPLDNASFIEFFKLRLLSDECVK